MPVVRLSFSVNVVISSETRSENVTTIRKETWGGEEQLVILLQKSKDSLDEIRWVGKKSVVSLRSRRGHCSARE
jgi:hypothetical protein